MRILQLVEEIRILINQFVAISEEEKDLKNKVINKLYELKKLLEEDEVWT